MYNTFGLNQDNICVDLNQSKTAIELYEQLNDKTSTIKDCPYPCKFIRSISTPRKLRNGSINELNFDKYEKFTKVKCSYTELQLLAELGGYVGLFLGTIHLRRRQVFMIFYPYPPTIGIPAKCLLRGFLILMYCDL